MRQTGNRGSSPGTPPRKGSRPRDSRCADRTPCALLLHRSRDAPGSSGQRGSTTQPWHRRPGRGTRRPYPAPALRSPGRRSRAQRSPNHHMPGRGPDRLGRRGPARAQRLQGLSGGRRIARVQSTRDHANPRHPKSRRRRPTSTGTPGRTAVGPPEGPHQDEATRSNQAAWARTHAAVAPLVSS